MRSVLIALCLASLTACDALSMAQKKPAQAQAARIKGCQQRGKSKPFPLSSLSTYFTIFTIFCAWSVLAAKPSPPAQKAGLPAQLQLAGIR